MSINVAMWRKALQVIPRLSKEEWMRLDVIAKWLIASRSAVLIITFISCGLAGILAFRAGQFNLGLWLLMTFGLLLAHATNNLLNDVTDYLRGVDRDNYFRTQYGPQPLEHGLMTMRQMLLYTGVTGLLALAAGLYLVGTRGGLTFPLLAAGVFFVLFYTFPLKYIGLGEIAVLVVWGPLMVGGGYYVLTGTWHWNVVLASLPYALGATSVIFGKHIDKCAADKDKGIHTLPVILGERTARYVAIGTIALQYVLIVYLVAIGFFKPTLLIVLLALRTFASVLRVYRQPKPTQAPANYPPDTWPLWFVGFAFYHNRRFGLLFMLGLIADVVWSRLVL